MPLIQSREDLIQDFGGGWSVELGKVSELGQGR